MTITQQQLDAMCEVISKYKLSDGYGESSLSWQWYAGLSGVGDITLIGNNDRRLAHVNTTSFQRSEEGQFLMQSIHVA